MSDYLLTGPSRATLLPAKPRCTDWNAARDGHSFECPVRREQERTPPPRIPERAEWDAEPMGGWEPRT